MSDLLTVERIAKPPRTHFECVNAVASPLKHKKAFSHTAKRLLLSTRHCFKLREQNWRQDSFTVGDQERRFRDLRGTPQVEQHVQGSKNYDGRHNRVFKFGLTGIVNGS